MEFDYSKVYSAVNADELRVGSKVMVANSLGVLKEKVFRATTTTKLLGIKPEQTANRFEVAEGLFLLAYLVEEPATLKWTDLKLGDVIANGKLKFMVTAIDSEEQERHIFAGNTWLSDNYLEEWVKEE